MGSLPRFHVLDPTATSALPANSPSIRGRRCAPGMGQWARHRGEEENMAKLVFGLQQSLDGYVVREGLAVIVVIIVRDQ